MPDTPAEPRRAKAQCSMSSTDAPPQPPSDEEEGVRPGAWSVPDTPTPKLAKAQSSMPSTNAPPQSPSDEEEGVLLGQAPGGGGSEPLCAPEGAERKTVTRRRSFAESIRRSIIMKKNGPRHDWFIRRRRRRRGSNRLLDSLDGSDDLEGYQQLVSDQNVFARSINSIRFAVFADTLNGMVLYPNYALMALPGAHAESFSSTAPFGFSSATYFIPMTGLLGMAISGIFSGRLSDHVGRKPVVLFCLAGSMFGSAFKWAMRSSFWGFCAANFVNGLLSGTLPVALAYCSDVFSSQRQKSKSFSAIVGLYVIGQSIGGILGILMQEHGLFAPLWAGVAIMFTALVINIRFLVEPGRIKVPADLGDDDNEEDMPALPTSIDKPTMIHILIGAFVDIAGSKALFPICMSPLAFQTFYSDFVDARLDPIMTIEAYKWLTVLVSILIVPSSVMAPKMFQRFGLAASCVFGNAITGVVIVALLFIANVDPPTRATFAGFVVSLYVGFPFTVISQLAISPMLDKLAPLERRGFVQGTFTTVLNCGNATAPWILGIAADALGTTNALWIGIGLSAAATLINAPLMRKKLFKPPPPKKKADMMDDLKLSPEEEEKYIQKALKGELIPARVIQAINIKRLENDEKFMVNHVGSYESDRDRLGQICSEGIEDLKMMRRRIHRKLAQVNTDPVALGQMTNLQHNFPDEMKNIHEEIGLWFGDYLKDNGYIGLNPIQNLKLMIIRSFPTIHRGEDLNAKDIEETMLNLNRVYNRYLQDELEAEQRTGLRNLFKRPPRRMAPVG